MTYINYQPCLYHYKVTDYDEHLLSIRQGWVHSKTDILFNIIIIAVVILTSFFTCIENTNVIYTCIYLQHYQLLSSQYKTLWHFQHR